MVFSSLNFLFIFLPVVLIIYFLFSKIMELILSRVIKNTNTTTNINNINNSSIEKINTIVKNTILFIFSLIFYAWGEPVYVVLMIFSTVVDFFHGRYVEHHRGTKKAKIALISSVVINLSLLGFFKYSDFLIENINAIFNSDIALLNLPLPIGISFYTFQTMSYTIDVYRNEAKAQKNIISFGAYVALFPQLIAGPIVRYQTIADQLVSRNENFDLFSSGVKRFVTGLAKKILLANTIGAVWTQISSLPMGNMSVLSAWLGIIAFAFQIYFDFSGYSDMAIGLGRIFGFDFPENFNYPYISKSISEFWRRWHISLGTWFREYVYIPLGGNRCKMSRQLFNIAVVWFLTGIWHGSSWNFAIWGLYYCVLLILEKTFLLKALKKAPAFVSHIYTIFCVIIGWVFFAFDSLSDGVIYLQYMFGLNGTILYNDTAMYLLLTNVIVLVILVVASTPLASKITAKIMSSDKCYVGKIILENGVLILMFVVSMAYLVDSTYNPFLYFRF